MIFKKLKIKNIRSYEDQEINFPKGSILLSGDIGSGKTTLLLAIEFALFGLQPGQKGISILRNSSNYGEIELEFSVNGKQITISRTLKRKKSVTQENSFIIVDGEKQEKSVTEIKNKVLELINYPQEFTKKTNLLYKFTVYTPQEEMKQIILENSEVRLNILRHVFGIDKYKRVKENSQILVSRIKELSKIKQGEISDLEEIKNKVSEKKHYLKNIHEKINTLNSKISEISLDISQREIEISGIKDKIDETKRIENEIEKTNILLTTKKERSNQIALQIQEINRDIEKIKNEFNQQEFQKISQQIVDSSSEISEKNNLSFEFSFKIDSLINRITDLTSLMEKISQLKTCPTCLQQVSSHHKNHLLDQTEKEISKLDSEKNKLSQDKNYLDKSIKNLEQKTQELNEKKQYLDSLKIKFDSLNLEKNKMSSLEKEKKFLGEDIELLSEQISRLKQTLLSYKKFENFFLIKQKELLEINSRFRALEIQKAQSEKEIDLTKIELNSLREKIKEKEIKKKDLQYLTELNNWIDSKFLPSISLIEKNVLSKLRNEFSKLFSQWFSILVPDTFSVRLNEEFTPVIEQQDFQLDYSFLSGGEKTAIALAYRLALNQTINSVLSEIKTKGVVILDEPTDGFSQKQLDKMRDVLSQLDVEQLIIVSHDPKIETFVEHVIKLEKQNNVSKVV
jgi:DNA repair protein SbcC/Rad50